MIPQKHAGGVEIDGLPGERSHFTIKPNGKAFRVLIDGLYSNKIQAVTREIWSNAADAHIAAGCPERPFKVWIPTELDPTFRVRDFGTGLSHDGVMHLYTTIFESSKESTNEQTGMLGLGSKSPFAYTDTFSVIAYDGTTKRVYVANIEADGVPAITHIQTAPCSEERGLEVSFPVNRGDVRTFAKEAQWISMGFKVKPETVGVSLKMPKPRMSGDTWALYYKSEWDFVPSSTLLRQGVACYPSNDTIEGLSHDYMAIIDIPIGTADVTASRESLSYTPDTRRAVQGIIRSTHADIKAHVEAEIAKAKTRRQIAQVNHDFRGMIHGLRGSTKVSLLLKPDEARTMGSVLTRIPGDVIDVMAEYGKPASRRHHINAARRLSEVEVGIIHTMKLYVDHGGKYVRKRERFQSAGRNAYVVKAEFDNTGREIAASWVKETLELRDDQIFSIDDLVDPGPTNIYTPTPKAKKVLAHGQYWMLRKNGLCDGVYGRGSMVEFRHNEGWSRPLYTALNHLSETNPLRKANILYVTEKEAEKMGLPQGRRFDVAVEAALIAEAKTLPIDEALSVIELTNSIAERTDEWKVIKANFFSHLTLSRDEATAIIEKAKYAKIDLTNRKIADTIRNRVRMLAAGYPLLFRHTSTQVLQQYVEQVQAANKAKEAQPA